LLTTALELLALFLFLISPFQLVGTFFLKAATYEFMKYNSIHGGESYFYSFEYEGQNSVFNLLFSGETPPLPHGE
jgi:hypothetical protein